MIPSFDTTSPALENTLLRDWRGRVTQMFLSMPIYKWMLFCSARYGYTSTVTPASALDTPHLWVTALSSRCRRLLPPTKEYIPVLQQTFTHIDDIWTLTWAGCWCCWSSCCSSITCGRWRHLWSTSIISNCNTITIINMQQYVLMGDCWIKDIDEVLKSLIFHCWMVVIFFYSGVN